MATPKKSPAAPKVRPAEPASANAFMSAGLPDETLFFAPLGQKSISVALPSGDRAIVTQVPRSLPARFHAEAAKAGCQAFNKQAVEMYLASQNAAATAFLAAAPTPAGSPVSADNGGPVDRIYAVLDEAMNQAPGAPGFEDAFVKDGAGNEIPNGAWVQARIGTEFTVNEADVAVAWNRVMDSMK